MIPVMILGMLISGKKYNWKDFLVAVLVTVGCVLFVQTGDITLPDRPKQDSVYGLLLMAGYLFSDGFTSTFQEKLFKGYNMSTYNQMLYVNIFSTLFILIKLIASNELLHSLSFSVMYPSFLMNSLILSVTSTTGQLVILITIKQFGALFFATIMTIRQVISIILSCIIYLHPLTLWQWLSSALVFGVLYYKDTMMRSSRHHGDSHSAPASSPNLDSTKTDIKIISVNPPVEQEMMPVNPQNSSKD
jgi:adenosine 3'-phospho 5'-phosphosulfate transporter B2